MIIMIGSYEFKGPYTSTDELEDRSGIYAVLCHFDSEYTVIDIGESAKVKTRVETHDRKECWDKNCFGELVVAVLYTPNKGKLSRTIIEQSLRLLCTPLCGDR